MTANRLPFLFSTASLLLSLALCWGCEESGNASQAAAGTVRQELITLPGGCGGCDPACRVSTDAPIGTDLTADNAENIRFDLDFDGIVIGHPGGGTSSYRRRLDGFITCDPGQTPFWDQIYFEVETPTDTFVDFYARTGESVAELEGAAEVLIATMPGDSAPADLQGRLAGAGFSNALRYLEMRVELRATSAGETSVFRNMNVVYYCLCDCDLDSECDECCACDNNC